MKSRTCPIAPSLACTSHFSISSILRNMSISPRHPLANSDLRVVIQTILPAISMRVELTMSPAIEPVSDSNIGHQPGRRQRRKLPRSSLAMSAAAAASVHCTTRLQAARPGPTWRTAPRSVQMLAIRAHHQFIPERHAQDSDQYARTAEACGRHTEGGQTADQASEVRTRPGREKNEMKIASGPRTGITTPSMK